MGRQTAERAAGAAARALSIGALPQQKKAQAEQSSADLTLPLRACIRGLSGVPTAPTTVKLPKFYPTTVLRDAYMTDAANIRMLCKESRRLPRKSPRQPPALSILSQDETASFDLLCIRFVYLRISSRSLYITVLLTMDRHTSRLI